MLQIYIILIEWMISTFKSVAFIWCMPYTTLLLWKNLLKMITDYSETVFSFDFLDHFLNTMNDIVFFEAGFQVFFHFCSF